MAGGTLYIEPILEELQEKIGELETGMSDIKDAMEVVALKVDTIPGKIDEQIDELQKIVAMSQSGLMIPIAASDNIKAQFGMPYYIEGGYGQPVLNLYTFANGTVKFKSSIRCQTSSGTVTATITKNGEAAYTFSVSVTNQEARPFDFVIPVNAYDIIKIQFSGSFSNFENNQKIDMCYDMVNVADAQFYSF